MRTSSAAIAILVGLCLLTCVAADDDAVLEVKGEGAGGREAYKGGGKIEFLDVSLADQLVHLASPEQIPLRLGIKYRVLETAPVLLNSRLGTEYWHLYHHGNDTMSALHTVEQIDLSKPGEAVATIEQARAGERYGALLRKGLVGIRGHYYFLIDQVNGEWLDMVRPPAFFDRPQLAEKLGFTLANLSEFSLEFSEIQSTWKPGGPIRVKLTVTDGDGDQFPVVNPPATIQAQGWEAELSPEIDYLHIPSAWLATNLPEGQVPRQVVVKATVSAMTPDGPRTRQVTKTFNAGDGQRTAHEMTAGLEPVALPRNADGIVRETRALWVEWKSMMTRESIETLVARAKEAGLNVLIPDIFVGSMLLANSDLFPMTDGVEEELDPVAYLIEVAHEQGMEVHPWFCVTYRDKHFREKLPGVEMIDENGQVQSVGADVHRPEYRDFIVNLMVGVARDYEVDGIHLDYIRSMGRCYCEKCLAEFQQQYGKPLPEATDEEWIPWQRQAIGEIIRRTAEGVRAVRPQAAMSAAVFAGMAGGAAQGQYPADWARQGWLDVVIPMDYRMQTLHVRAHERQFLAALADDDKLVTGLSLYVRHGKKVIPRSAELVKEQIHLVRSMGIHGYCLFAYTYLNDEILEMLKTEINNEPALLYFR